jgi:hypothetical protein
MAFLDTSIERCLKRDNVLDIFLKVIPLAGFMYATFMLGIGGLFLFTGALELKLSSRIVYYVTVPILTGIWLDWELPENWDDWKKKKEFEGDDMKAILGLLKKVLSDGKKWFSIVLGLLAILAPQLVSTAHAGSIDTIIQALESLRF